MKSLALRIYPSNRIKYLPKHELIGLEVEIIDAKIENYKGIHGIVIDETKNTLKIKTEKGVKTVIKEFCTFLFYINGFIVKIDGKLLKGRPWERIKKRIKK